MKQIICLAFAVFCLGCVPAEKPLVRPRLVLTDDVGRTVRLDSTPARVISFAPNITEMIYALGADDRLIGVTSWCNYPPQAREKEVIGDYLNVNLERIMSLKPDLVFMIGTINSPLLAKLEALQIPVLVLNPVSLGDISKDIRLLSLVLDKPAAADSLLKAFGSALQGISSSLEGIPQDKWPKVFAEISSQPLMSAGANSFVGQLISQAGGQNIMADISQDYAVINPEIVIQRRPDIILILHPQTDKKQLSGRLGWENIPAVKSKKVFDDLNLDVVLRAGPRFVLGLHELNKRFYEK